MVPMMASASNPPITSVLFTSKPLGIPWIYFGEEKQKQKMGRRKSVWSVGFTETCHE